MADRIISFLTDQQFRLNGDHAILVLSSEDDFWAQKPEELRFIAQNGTGFIVKPGDKVITSESLVTLLEMSSSRNPDLIASLILSKHNVSKLQSLHAENSLTPEELANDIKPIASIAWASLNKPKPAQPILEQKPDTVVAEQPIEEPIVEKQQPEPVIEKTTQQPEEAKQQTSEVKETQIEVKEAQPEVKECVIVKSTEVSEPIKTEPQQNKVQPDETTEPQKQNASKPEQTIVPNPIVMTQTQTKTVPQSTVERPKMYASHPQPPVITLQRAPPAVPKQQTRVIHNPNIQPQFIQARPPQDTQPKKPADPNPAPVQQAKPAKKDTINVLGWEFSTAAALTVGTFGLIGGCAALYFMTRTKPGTRVGTPTSVPSLPAPMATPQFNMHSI